MKRMLRCQSSLVAVVLITVLAVLAACAPQPTPTPAPPTKKEATPAAVAPAPAPTPAPTPTPKPKILVVAVSETPQTLDIMTSAQLAIYEIGRAAYESPLGYKQVRGPEGFLEPDFSTFEGRLAESWEVSPDKKTFTFRLRKGVKSAAGNELTAEDVKWTWDRGFLSGKSVSIPFFALLTSLKGPESITVPDRYTVQFKTEQPTMMMLPTMALQYGYIIDSVEAKKNATADDPWALKWLSQNVAGFGPYRVTKYTPGQEVNLQAWEGYWGGKPKIDTIVYREVPSSATRLAMVQRGDVDVALDLTAKERQQLEGQAGVKIASWRSNFFHVVQMNFKYPPFDNKKVRQAVSYAIPYDDIISTVFLGKARRMKSSIPDIYPGYVEASPYKYDLEKAKALLAEAGFPTGFKTILSYTSTIPEEETMAVLIKTSLARIGVEVELEKLALAVHSERQLKKNMAFFLYKNYSMIPDPGYDAFLFYFSQSIINYSNYKNDEVDGLIMAGVAEPDVAKRTEMFKRQQGIVVDDAAWAYIALPGQYVAMRSNVKPGSWYTENALRLVEWDKE